MVAVSGWGFVGDFLAFLDEIGFYALRGSRAGASNG